MKQSKWQDKVITLVALGFMYSLLPQILLNYQLKMVAISWQTISITCVGLYTMSLCFFMLKLHFSAIANVITAILWTIILVQKFIY